MNEKFWPALLALAVSATGFAFLVQKYAPRRGQTFVEPEELKKRLDAGEDILVLDLRPAGEYDARTGHIPGAVSLPVADFTNRLEAIRDQLEPFKKQMIIVACRFENRSPKVANSLKEEGFSNVAVLKGGFMRWMRHGLPTDVTS